MDPDEALARICFLGKPALFIAGRLHAFGGPRKAIALLAYLLLHHERSLSRAALAEQFWPDEDAEGARAALRRHLHRALSALPEAPPGRSWVIADKVTLRWNPAAPLEVDTQLYERLSAAGERGAAVQLYRGDYLDSLYDDWVLPERERLRGLQAANLVALVDERRRALDYPGAIAFAQALLRLDPLHESAIRRLMSLRFASGDRSGALAEFEAFRRRLRDELSTDPMPETLALREAIRANELSALENAPLETVPQTSPGFPFTGRTEPLRVLRRAWEDAARGTASTVLVSGEAGAGKSRLIGELMVLAEAQGGRVLFGTTATLETEPYQPIAEAVRGGLPLLRFDRLEPSKLAALAAFVPDVRELVNGIPQLTPLEPERDRERLFDALESAFAQLAEKRPLLVVLEDLHWAGTATIELLEYLVRRLRGRSVLVVVSFREEEVEGAHAVRGFVRRLDVARSAHVALGPLDVEDVSALIAHVVPQNAGTLARDVFAASEGNALFVTELLRERLSGSPGDAIPAGIAGTVLARLERLSAPARSLVEAAAVAGVGFDADALRQSSGWSFAEVFDALDELLDRALVRASPQHRGEFVFSHQLVHAAVYGAVEEPARRLLHRRFARTLEQLYGKRPSLAATLARHYEAAGLPEDAVTHYVGAARYALDVFAHADASTLATRALALAPDARRRFELHALREEAATRAADAVRRRVDTTAMLEIARELSDDELLGIALKREFAFRLQVAEREDAAAAAAELRALGQRVQSPEWVVEAAIAQARLEVDRSDQKAAEVALSDAEPLAADVESDALAFDYWWQRAFGAGWTDPARAREFLEHARRRAGENELLRARTLRMEAQIADIEGNAAALRRAARESLELYVKLGDLEGQATAHRNLASAAWYEFDVAANREHTARAIELYERVQKPNAMAAMIYHRGNSALQLGDLAKAEADVAEARAIWESLGIPGNACSATRNLATIAAFRGDPERARELAHETLARAREIANEREEINALDLLGSAERDLGLLAEACEHLETALHWRRERDPRQALEGLIELIPAYLALERRDDALEAAAELLRGLELDRTAVGFPAQGFAVAATAYEAAGESERARGLRVEAATTLRELAARIDDEAGRRGYLALPVHRGIALEDAPIPGGRSGNGRSSR